MITNHCKKDKPTFMLLYYKNSNPSYGCTDPWIELFDTEKEAHIRRREVRNHPTYSYSSYPRPTVYELKRTSTFHLL